MSLLFSNLLDLDVLFGQFDPSIQARNTSWSKTTDGGYQLKMVIPGFDLEDIKIFSTANKITIKAKNESQNKFAMGVSEFERTYSVPLEADIERIDVSYKAGVLLIQMPPKNMESQVKEIPIKALSAVNNN